MIDAAGLGVVEAGRLIAAGDLAPTRYAEDLLAHIAACEPRIRAFASLDPARVRREAQACERAQKTGGACGPLHGVPVGIKDLFDVAGIETRAGSPLLAGNVALRDSLAVARLRAAGAIVLGKTAMTVFAAMDPAATVNPWNPAHTPGGSSSGSAAAVASGMCPAALGTQTAGSVLRPAAYCGVAGLKPTYDAIPRHGLFPCAWSMDHAGILARSVADLRALYDVLADPMPPRPQRAPLVMGIPDRYFADTLDADVAAAWRTALDVFRAAGVAVREVTLPATFEAGVDAGIVIMYAEMAAVHRERFAVHRDLYPPRITVLIGEGLRIAAADYLRAQQVRRQFVDDLSALFAEIDGLLTPATPAPAPEGLGATGDWRFNLPFSASGHPAMSIPCGFSRAGLPIGLQVVAGHGREDVLFAAGELFEAATAWHGRRPPAMAEA